MELDKLTIGEAKQLAAMFTLGGALPLQPHPYEVGGNYFIRTVTHHLTGRLVGVYDDELVIEDAAWIADDGRYEQAVKEGKFSEVEPYADGMRVIVGRGSLIDAVKVGWALPRSAK